MENLFDMLIIFCANYLIIFIIGVALLYLFKQPRNKQKQIIIFSLISLPLIYITAKILSVFYYDPRPFVSSHLVPLISHDPDNGFPSDHALLGSAISAIIFCFNRKVGIFLFVLTLLVGTARVMAGVHHPIDIVGSVVVAFGITSLVQWKIFPRSNKNQK